MLRYTPRKQYKDVDLRKSNVPLVRPHTALGERLNMLWRIWYRTSETSDKYYLGVAEYRNDADGKRYVTVKNGNCEVGGRPYTMTPREYSAKKGHTICEYDPQEHEWDLKIAEDSRNFQESFESQEDSESNSPPPPDDANDVESPDRSLPKMVEKGSPDDATKEIRPDEATGTKSADGAPGEHEGKVLPKKANPKSEQPVTDRYIFESPGAASQESATAVETKKSRKSTPETKESGTLPPTKRTKTKNVEGRWEPRPSKRQQRKTKSSFNAPRPATGNEGVQEETGKEDVEEVDVRAEYQAEAVKQAKVLGDKRVEAKYKKRTLEVGDTVDYKVSFKHRTSAGDKVILGVVSESLGRNQYHILTAAGVLAMRIQRNDLIHRPERSAEVLGIPDCVQKLPPISEKHALALICPMRQTISTFCKCVNVSTIQLWHNCIPLY